MRTFVALMLAASIGCSKEPVKKQQAVEKATKKVEAEKESAPADEKPPLQIDPKSVKVEWVDGVGKHKGKSYLRVHLEVTSREATKETLGLKAICDVGGKKLTDTTTALGEGLDKLDPGETKKLKLDLWRGNPLDAMSKACTIKFSLGEEWSLYENDFTWD